MTMGIVTASATAFASATHSSVDFVGAVGIGPFEVQAEEARTFHRLGALGHVDDGLAAGIEFLLAGHGVLFHTKVGQLDADLRRVLDLRVKGMERQDILPADRGGFVTNAKHHFIDVGVESLLLGTKGIMVNPPI